MRAILNKSWRQHPTKHQLYAHLPLIMKTIKVRRTRHAGHCSRSRDKFISDVLLWTPSYGRAKAGRSVRNYIQQLCEYTGCSPEDLPEAMNDWEEWREKIRNIRADGTTGWWWLLWQFFLSLTFFHISLNLFLWWHLKVNWLGLIKNRLVNLYLLILIFSSRQMLHFRRKIFLNIVRPLSLKL